MYFLLDVQKIYVGGHLHTESSEIIDTKGHQRCEADALLAVCIKLTPPDLQITPVDDCNGVHHLCSENMRVISYLGRERGY